MKKNFKLFFDMDDTIADFGSNRHQHDIEEYSNRIGTFENLMPLPFLEEVNKIAAVCPENVFIISSCVNNDHCKEEKIKWLKKHLPAAMKENVIFSINGQSKAEVLKNEHNIIISKYDILIDDHSRNISDWETLGGTAIKFKNDFNTKDPSKYKYIISNLSELLNLLTKIRADFNE